MKLKIGYVSPDFRTHSVAYFLEPLLKSHNKENFELFGYYNNSKQDETNSRLKSYFDHWEEVEGLSDEDLADKIYNDQVDILVDLAGHSANNRLAVLAQKPAPIQATWLGYPNTSGLSTIDYRITDEIADPSGESEPFNTEKLIRLENGFLCYQGDKDVPAIHELPYDRNGYFTFGSFNNYVKVTPEVISVWSEILKAVERSRLILKSNQLGDAMTSARCLALFAAHDIKPERITLCGMIPNNADHLAYYGEVDLALDPFPYNGTTTTFEALWMGVPTLTLKGKVHASRVGASILSRIGLHSYVAGTVEEYVKIAQSKSQALEELRILRRDLRQQMINSSLCDSADFAKQIEKAYAFMWKTYRESV